MIVLNHDSFLRNEGHTQHLIPPGDRLEALKGNRKGKHSIRINDQIRICFLWKDGDCYEVEIIDYHS